ncbi:MAG: type I pullulanase [Oscillospiraceae bacterium]|nr:type I pullulanase [Oscillospiraceae bacterium]
MKKKRLLSLILAALMLLGLLSGCGKTKSPPAAEEAAPPPAQAEESVPETSAAPAQAEAEYSLPPEAGCRQLTLYWASPNGNYDNCDIWVWFPGRDGHGELFHPCAYGGKVVLNVPESVEEVGFIVRRDCSQPGGSSWGEATKDFDGDRFAVLTGPSTEIYLKSGDEMQYMSRDGGATLEARRSFKMAGILSPTEIRYTVSPAARITSLDQIRVLDGDRALPIESLSSLDNEVVLGTITLAEPIDLSHSYTVEIEGYGSAPAVPTGIFDSKEFVSDYVYDGDDLGATIVGDKTVFKLWAPTASEVTLRLFEKGDGGEPFAEIAMERGDKGVWSASCACGHGTYYTYLVTTCLGTQEAVDPYARAAGVNGDRGMVIDLGPTDPVGFRAAAYQRDLASYEDAVIWEVHVRDFSNTIASSQYPGKYLAFTETGLTNAAGVPVGVDYLRDLGVTHVHLQPVYDYATVNEASDAPQFNWGYDPKNYNVPEGSYSIDPFNGAVRVTEFKQMVQSLHQQGIGVVMDVVYNHTYSLDSNLNRVVPYYYYRFGADGSPSNGSGCGNETASERAMFRKYMVDSVCYWAKEYQIDGFRFDLMALHDITTMQAIEKALHEIDPQILIYGEGWTGGDTPLREDRRASQTNIRMIKSSENAVGSIAVFNDVIRDGLKGSVFDIKDTGYINGKANKTTAAKVIFGICGGRKNFGANWHVNDAMVINYMSSHDNHTLWDKLNASCPGASNEEKLSMQRLGASVVMLSRGTPFFLAGEEMLRSKGGDGNSYASSDAVNNLDWESLVPGSDAYEMSRFYRELIALRRSNDFFTTAEVEAEADDDNVISVKWTKGGALVACAFINPNAEAVTVTLPDGSWTALLGGAQGALSGETQVEARGVLIAKK